MLLKNRTIVSVHSRLLLVSLLTVSPVAFAASDTAWLDTLIQYSTALKVGLFALAGVIVLCCVVISGIKLGISRMAGNHDKTFWDYIGDLSMALWIGGGMGVASGLWTLLGTYSG